ncbi:type VI secretion system ATPase TssH [Chitinispirillales bacterium ANBcel5]|uniref:type VI secretion system ATPase TssH n=1 Tax=Cellulosispirillum alkaliphilum TaxID=3039283 RepID=UPI002A4F308C|nr:type VI secretion system ATPase TssH [Chitinispirillales bacterium ANBcel5]
MVVNDIRTLLEKLNSYCQKKFQNSIGICVSNTNYELNWEHLFYSILEDADNDVVNILRANDVDSSRLKKALINEIEGFKKGNSARPTFSPTIIDLLEQAWNQATLRYNSSSIRSGMLFLAALEKMKLSYSNYAAMLRHIDEDLLKKDLLTITEKSCESESFSGKDSDDPEDIRNELEKYCKNLTAEAKDGKIDPILGRDSEIFQVIDILSRRRKNNPILVGEAGVGKTAVLEGLAQQIAGGDVPVSLRDVEIWEIDLGLLQAGASVKGEFEKRLKSIIDIAKKSAGRIILFIDEAHTLIGAGGAAGMGDAANLLKPALARGELRTCAATTWLEYRKYFEKDPALTRRFQVVKVEEPDEEKCCAMLRGIAESYESHHGVHITEEGIRAAVSLSQRFISGRQLPDKAVDVLDTAATRVKMSRTTSPPQIEKLKKDLADAQRALKTLHKDVSAGIEVDKNKLEMYESIKQGCTEKIDSITDVYNDQKACVEEIVSIQKKLLEQGENCDCAEELKTKLNELNRKYKTESGEQKFVYPHVSADICAQVIADWTGIPVGSMLKDEAKILLELNEKLNSRVKGQEFAISEISSTVRSAKTGMTNPDAPLGVFLCTGPSGVGKTECAMALADILFGGEKFSTVINMSEYQEKHTVSQLKGSPPGYVGYGEGGVLTEAVRQKPYSIIILDEVEKAHRDVLNMFYQVFDKGMMRDGEGRDINFRNTVIIMTSNLGTDTIFQAQSEGINDCKQIIEYIRPELTHHFQPALLARCNVIPFLPLTEDVLRSVIGIKLSKVENRLQQTHNAHFCYSDQVVDAIAQRCSAAQSGARNIDVVINSSLLPAISSHLLSNVGLEDNETEKVVVVDVDDSGDFTISFDQNKEVSELTGELV